MFVIEKINLSSFVEQKVRFRHLSTFIIYITILQNIRILLTYRGESSNRIH